MRTAQATWHTLKTLNPTRDNSNSTSVESSGQNMLGSHKIGGIESPKQPPERLGRRSPAPKPHKNEVPKVPIVPCRPPHPHISLNCRTLLTDSSRPF
ncbi:hypothetical protein BGZ60DRAFT_397984 [Tricladium varicosporioides]|nr:hypothetical protein BGZ60DRAFT_397984 [Hymenoscyphus varicosporioides]